MNAVIISNLIIIFCSKFSSSYDLTILHNNDFHARYTEIDEFNSECDNKVKECFGGLARTAAKVNEIKKNTKNVLFLSGGDNYQGTLYYSVFKYNITARLMKLMNFDAMALGNHEFDDGVEGLAPYLEEMKPVVPFVCCNINLDNENRLKPLLKKSTILEVGGKRIGVIGYITPETSYLSSPGGTISFNDEIGCIRGEAQNMKATGVDIIIAVGHSGYRKDMEIANSIPEVDVVVGGHSNSFLYNPPDNPPSKDIAIGSYPQVIDHPNGDKTLVVQAFAFGKYLGKLNLVFDDEGKITSFDGNPILMDKKIEKDVAIEKILNEEYLPELNKKFGVTVASTRVLLEGDFNCRRNECNLGSLITDSLVHHMTQKKNNPDGWTYYPIALVQGGSVRSSIDASSRNGQIILKDLYTVLPFGNEISVLTLSGKRLVQALEYSVQDYDYKAPHGKFLQVSGLRIAFDLGRENGNRVKSVETRCGNCRVPKFEPLSLDKNYTIVTSTYIGNGGDGYAMFTKDDVIKEPFGDIILDVLNAYAEKITIIIGNEDRTKLINSQSEDAKNISWKIFPHFYCIILVFMCLLLK